MSQSCEIRLRHILAWIILNNSTFQNFSAAFKSFNFLFAIDSVLTTHSKWWKQIVISMKMCRCQPRKINEHVKAHVQSLTSVFNRLSCRCDTRHQLVRYLSDRKERDWLVFLAAVIAVHTSFPPGEFRYICK